MYSLYPVTMDIEPMDTEALERQSLDRQLKDGQSVGETTDGHSVEEEPVKDMEPGITVVSNITSLILIAMTFPAYMYCLWFGLNYFIFHFGSNVFKPV